MATDVRTYRHYIDGSWVESQGGGSRTITSPATGEVLAEVAEGTAADVDRAVEAAKTAFDTWYDATPGERQAALLKMADLVD
ncbi:MAG TPA: aldehyde dehydrogenase family protein, partial [Actinomycetota bacterium]|nr:aldehyde dehydrogenase family protein [Actinomycetota bacterium]